MGLSRPVSSGLDRLINAYAEAHGAEPARLRITHEQHARLAAEWGLTTCQSLTYRGIRIQPTDPVHPESQSP